MFCFIQLASNSETTYPIVGNYYGKLTLYKSASFLVYLHRDYSPIGGYSHFVLSGKGIYGFLTPYQGRSSKQYRKKSPHRWVVFYCDNLAVSKPYTIYAPETKTTDPTERRIKKMSDKPEADSN